MNEALITVLVVGLIAGINLFDRHRKKHPAGGQSAAAAAAVNEGAMVSGGKATKAAARSIKAINTVIGKKQGAVQFCYKKELRKAPGLSGKITVKFTIEHSGLVSKATVVSTSMGSASFNACINKVIQSLRFKPIGAENGSMTVTYPFVFRAG